MCMAPPKKEQQAEQQPGEVRNGTLLMNNSLRATGCHHTRGTDACGGCYARLDAAIDKALEKCEAALAAESPAEMHECVQAAHQLLTLTITQRLNESVESKS